MKDLRKYLDCEVENMQTTDCREITLKEFLEDVEMTEDQLNDEILQETKKAVADYNNGKLSEVPPLIFIFKEIMHYMYSVTFNFRRFRENV